MILILSHRRDVSTPETSWQCQFRPFSGWLAPVCDSRIRVGLILDGETLCNIQFICHCITDGAMSAATQTMSEKLRNDPAATAIIRNPLLLLPSWNCLFVGFSAAVYISCGSGTVSSSNDSIAGISPPATVLLVLIKVPFQNLAFRQYFLEITATLCLNNCMFTMSMWTDLKMVLLHYDHMAQGLFLTSLRWKIIDAVLQISNVILFMNLVHSGYFKITF